MLTETLVSSFILVLIAISSFTLNTESLRALSRSKEKDRRMAEIHSINENVRQKVSRWRKSSDPTMDRYEMEASLCGDNMASLLLKEMQIQTPNTLEAAGRFVISKNEGFPDAVIYLPQAGWCP